MASVLLLLLLLTTLCGVNSEQEDTQSQELVPLVIWPGMGDSCCYVFGAAGYQGIIQRMIPQIYIKIIAFGKTAQEDSYNSFFLNSNTQVELACQLLSSDPKLKKGFNAMGFSQGSQFLRALVQRCDKVKIFNLLSVGGQHQGVYGFPFCMGEETWYCDLFRQFLSIGVYLTIFQDYLVQASYWHDPHDEESYQLDSLFLSDINQELKLNPVYKERLSNLSNFVLIKFEQDMMVQPRETQWFGFYKPGQAIETYSLFESKIYTRDLLGLKYLYNEGRLHLLSSPNGHTLLTYDWLDKYIIPFIKSTYTDVYHPIDLSGINKREREKEKKRQQEEEEIKEEKQNREKGENNEEQQKDESQISKNGDKEKDHYRYTSISSIFSNKKIITDIIQPSSIHIIPNGTVFISTGDKLVYQFDSMGNLIRTIGPFLNGVQSITGYRDQWLYVSSGNSVYRYSLSTGEYSGTVFELRSDETSNEENEIGERESQQEDEAFIIKEGNRRHKEGCRHRRRRGRRGGIFRHLKQQQCKKHKHFGRKNCLRSKREGRGRNIKGQKWEGWMRQIKRCNNQKNGEKLGKKPTLLYMSVDNQGLLYISTQQSEPGLIHVINNTGHHLTDLTIGTQPMKTQFDSKEHIRVIDNADKSIYVLTKHNLHLRTYPMHLSSPHGLFIDKYDNMLVTNREGNLVAVYDDSGSQHHNISGFTECSDVHVSFDGTLWVSDTSANKVYLFQL